MPSRKQRRRREKLKRHEYEYVVESEEGEVRLDRLRRLDEKEGGKDGRSSSRQPVDRRGRPVPKPSLERVLKRSAIFAPILFVFVYLTGANRLSTGAIVLNVVILLALFIPFSYVVDVVLYRMMLRRRQRAR